MGAVTSEVEIAGEGKIKGKDAGTVEVVGKVVSEGHSAIECASEIKTAVSIQRAFERTLECAVKRVREVVGERARLVSVAVVGKSVITGKGTIEVSVTCKVEVKIERMGEFAREHAVIVKNTVKIAVKVSVENAAEDV